MEQGDCSASALTHTKIVGGISSPFAGQPLTPSVAFAFRPAKAQQHPMSNCTLCKTHIPAARLEAWTTETGEVVQVTRSTTPSAVAETSAGEFEICEDCYHRNLPPFFTPQDVSETHYQFGLEYFHDGEFSRSVKSLTHALMISETADVLAALALAEDELGLRDAAIAHFRRALEIDPSHLISLHNLKRLRDDAAQC